MSLIILGFAGQKHSGKSTAAKYFARSLQFTELSFAGPCKEALSHAFSIELKYFTDNSLKEQKFPKKLKITEKQIIDFLDYINENYLPLRFVEREKSLVVAGKEIETPRELMQFMATELAREEIRKDFWTEILRRRIRKSPHKKFVISDVRFPDERETIAELGGKTILVLRDEKPDDSHVSETSLGKKEDYDVYVKNTGTVNQFLEELHLWYSLKRLR